MKEQNDEMMRLQKFIALAGVASRRKAEEMILAGQVRVNGETIKEMGYKVDRKDKVYVNNKPVFLNNNKIYILLNKPKGYITTASDEKLRKTIFELVDINERVFPVGRLDLHTSGLLILTNDGDFAYKMTHPSHEIPKTYIAVVKGIPDKTIIDKMEKGIKIDGKTTAPSKIKIINTVEGKTEIEIIITEGKNRQVRKMLESVGYFTFKLKRVKIGKLSIGTLPSGKWRYLNEKEVKSLVY